MKILFLLCDMLRANLLKTFNTDIKKRVHRLLVWEVGGEYFTNCYTPAPDTPRSLACLYSGKYLKEMDAREGCISRITI